MHFMRFVSITLEFSFHGAWRVRSHQEQHSGVAAAYLRSCWISSVCYLKYFSLLPLLLLKEKKREDEKPESTKLLSLRNQSPVAIP